VQESAEKCEEAQGSAEKCRENFQRRLKCSKKEKVQRLSLFCKLESCEVLKVTVSVVGVLGV